MKRKLKVLSQLWTPFTESRAGVYASAASYYILLSIPSAVMLAASALPYLPQLGAQLSGVISASIPQALLPTISSLLESLQRDKAPALLSVSFLATLWSSAKGMTAVLDGLHAMFELPKIGFFHRRFRGIMSLLALTFGFVLVSFLIFLTYTLLFFAVRLLPPIEKAYSILVGFHGSFLFFLLSILFCACFRIICQKATLCQAALSGAAVSLSWVAVAEAFSVYMRWSLLKGRTLTDLSILFLGMLWLRLSILILLYGAVLCRLLSGNAYHPARIIGCALKTFRRKR